MENWDDDLTKIMEKKLKQYQDQLNNNSMTSSTGKDLIESVNTPITLTEYNFEESIKRYPLLVVDFWAPWCGPCRTVSPVIDSLAREMSGKVVFGKLNVDENPTISNIFGVQSIPTIMIFKNGNVVDGFMGAVSKPQMISTISKHI